MIDPITNYILEQDDHYLIEQEIFDENTMLLDEGVLTVMNKFFVLFGFGRPADPRVKAISKAYFRCKSSCWKAYPDEVETTSTTQRRSSGERGQTDGQIDKEKQETIETVKRNPERGKCLIMCLYDNLKETIDVIKKDRRTICDKNINKDLCEKWIDRYLPQLEADLKSLENAVRLMKGGKEGDQQKIKVVVNTLKKVL